MPEAPANATARPASAIALACKTRWLRNVRVTSAKARTPTKSHSPG